MHKTHLLSALTLVNLGILIFVVSHRAVPVQASGPEQVIRARALGNRRCAREVAGVAVRHSRRPSRRNDGTPIAPNGKVYPEAVVFRLIRPDGRPSVKIATAEQGSGIDLSGGIDHISLF